MLDAINAAAVVDAMLWGLIIVMWGRIIGYVGRGAYHAGYLSVPPWPAPEDKESWQVLAALRLVPKPHFPCGCEVDWEDLSYHPRPDADGTVRTTIGEFTGARREWQDIRHVVADNAGVHVGYTDAPTHTCKSCGASWLELPGPSWRPEPLTGMEYTTYERPQDHTSMRGLPDGWTRLDRGLNDSAGQVTEYAHGDTWDAFVDVYETDHVGNTYDISKGRYVAILRVGSPDEGLWERDRNFAADQNAAAKPLMEQFNEEEDGEA